MEKKEMKENNIVSTLETLITLLIFSVIVILVTGSISYGVPSIIEWKTTEKDFQERNEIVIEEEENPPAIEVTCGTPTGKLESLEYRGITLFWEEGNPMPEERLEIFCRVIDSLIDDLQYKYSLKNHKMDVYYLTEESFYMGNLTGGIPTYVAAFQRGDSIWLSPLLVDSNQLLFLHGIYNAYGPWESFHSGQMVDSGCFAMTLIHEYVHVLQHNTPEYLYRYAKDVGWEEVEEGNFSKPEELSLFDNVLSTYSLSSPLEDMSETFMFSYLCGNNLERLSEERLEHIYAFWGTENREDYCQDFD